MNFILEQRQLILEEGNTAQSYLKDFLEKFNKSSRDISILEPLHGDLDFSILKDYGITNITKIVLTKGEITGITGLPESLLEFECPDNLLISLDGLPSNLIRIEIPYNYLENFDVASLTKLEMLIVNDNKLTDIENIPSTIKELNCSNNKLTFLNLTGIIGLQKLIVSNNPITVIENLPEGIVDFKMENTPSIEFRNSSAAAILENRNDDLTQTQKNKKNVNEALNEYFKMKNLYQEKNLKMKQKVFEKIKSKREAKKEVLKIKPPCVKCKRPVGSVFEKKNNRYIARCGDAVKPCSLDIAIFTGNSMTLDYTLELFREECDESKETIIRQKLNTLFNYTTEEQSIRIFKQKLEDYNSESNIYKDLLNRNNELFHNVDKQHLIDKKNDIIFHLNERVQDLLKEYKKTQNKEVLNQAVHIQIKEIQPEIRNLRNLKYEIMEMNEVSEKNQNIYTVFQYPIELSKLINNSGEPPRVIKFVK
jgi:hypothetical protein